MVWSYPILDVMSPQTWSFDVGLLPGCCLNSQWCPVSPVMAVVGHGSVMLGRWTVSDHCRYDCGVASANVW